MGRRLLKRMKYQIAHKVDHRDKEGVWYPYDRCGVNDPRDYQCSLCDGIYSFSADYCPTCGAKMLGVMLEER